MENQKNNQSDLMRAKAGNVDSLLLVLDWILILSGVGSAFIYAVEMRGTLLGLALIAVFTVLMVYALNVTLSSKAEFYRTQAAILDALNEINNNKKES